MRTLIIEGKECIEWWGYTFFRPTPRPSNVLPGPPDYYRDGLGDVRVYAPDGQNHIVEAAEAAGGES